MTPLFVGRLEQRPIYLAKIDLMGCCSIISFERNFDPLDQNALRGGGEPFDRTKVGALTLLSQVTILSCWECK